MVFEARRTARLSGRYAEIRLRQMEAETALLLPQPAMLGFKGSQQAFPQRNPPDFRLLPLQL